MIAYAVIAVLGALCLWFALEWHRAREERDDAISDALYNAEVAEFNHSIVLRSAARVKELEAQLAAANPVSVPSCWANTTLCQGSTLTVGCTTGTVLTDILVDAVVPQVVGMMNNG